MVVSRQALIESGFSTVVCAPVYTRRDGIATQVDVGPEARVVTSSIMEGGAVQGRRRLAPQAISVPLTPRSRRPRPPPPSLTSAASQRS